MVTLNGNALFSEILTRTSCLLLCYVIGLISTCLNRGSNNFYNCGEKFSCFKHKKKRDTILHNKSHYLTPHRPNSNNRQSGKKNHNFVRAKLKFLVISFPCPLLICFLYHVQLRSMSALRRCDSKRKYFGWLRVGQIFIVQKKNRPQFISPVYANVSYAV